MVANVTTNRGYQLPDGTNYLDEDVLRLIAALNAVDVDVASILTSISGLAVAGHTHNMADIIGLAAALAAKADSGHNHALGSLTGINLSGIATGQFLRYDGTDIVPVAFDGSMVASGTINGARLGSHGHAQSDITGLVAALAAKADASALTSKADLASPSLTGTPTAPTATVGTNSTQIATTAFVKAAIDAVKNGVSAAFDTLAEIATELGLKAPLASPAFTGAPTAPTAAPGTNSTVIATTSFVAAAVAAGGGWQKIETLTPSGVASVQNTVSLAGYKAVRITLVSVLPVNNTNQLIATVSSDGSSFNALNEGNRLDIPSASNSSANSGTLTGTTVSNAAADGGVSGELKFYNLNSTNRKQGQATMGYRSTAGSNASYLYTAEGLNGAAMSHFRLAFNTGNIASGTVIIEVMA